MTNGNNDSIPPVHPMTISRMNVCGSAAGRFPVRGLLQPPEAVSPSAWKLTEFRSAAGMPLAGPPADQDPRKQGRIYVIGYIISAIGHGKKSFMEYITGNTAFKRVIGSH